ncbi:MAG TPA: anthranilate synthase component 1 [Candidatus Polarisedimenticolaceae bacterium]|nr:anthranilate synthase component 1 [Candidatus Polarisedimenticolaceae bacterium]
MTPLDEGSVLPLVREVTGRVDPLAVYRTLSDGGRRAGTFLLESAETAGGAGERSLIGASPALRIVCRDRLVTIRATSSNGRSLLGWAQRRLGGEREGDELRVPFPAPPPGPRDEASRGLLPSPLDAIRELVLGPKLLARPAEACLLAAGVFSYDLLELFEDLPEGRPEAAPTPHFELVIPDRLVIVDHVRHRTLLVANAFGGPDGEANYHDAAHGIASLLQAVEGAPPHPAARPADVSISEDLSDADFAELVGRLRRHIVAGDVFQIVASRTFSLPCPDPLGAYAALRADNPSPYLFYVRGERSTLLGASPETAVKVHGTPRKVAIRPIAGTAARGRDASGALDADLDARREAALRLDAKEIAEHMMLVDLARNDVARVSRPGTRRVARLLDVHRYSQVMHLVSEVEGELAPGLDALHAYASAMNMGTLVGAPKIRAAQILREVEPSRRGAYGGAVGYLTCDGEMDTAIVIRAAVVREGIAAVRAGAGIVFDSDPAAEARETRRKAEAVLRAIASGGGGA